MSNIKNILLEIKQGSLNVELLNNVAAYYYGDATIEERVLIDELMTSLIKNSYPNSPEIVIAKIASIYKKKNKGKIKDIIVVDDAVFIKKEMFGKTKIDTCTLADDVKYVSVSKHDIECTKQMLERIRNLDEVGPELLTCLEKTIIKTLGEEIPKEENDKVFINKSLQNIVEDHYTLDEHDFNLAIYNGEIDRFVIFYIKGSSKFTDFPFEFSSYTEDNTYLSKMNNDKEKTR